MLLFKSTREKLDDIYSKIKIENKEDTKVEIEKARIFLKESVEMLSKHLSKENIDYLLRETRKRLHYIN